METQTTAAPLSSRIRLPDALSLSVAAAVVIGFAIHKMHGDAPLWLDETGTGAIAAEPSLRAVIYQDLHDVNAPLYYVIAHYWSLLFGLSNGSLRFPAFVFATVAPLLCLIPVPGLPRRVNLLWCGLTALWIPGLAYAQEARCYSLLLCVGIATTLTFVRLIDTPGIKRAAVWGCCASLAIATHYGALILVGLQGLTYLGLHGRRAVRTWPAAFVFVPIFVWLAIHAQYLTAYADAHAGWQHLMTLPRLIVVFVYAAGSPAMLAMLVLLGIIGALFVLKRRPAAIEEDNGHSRAFVAAIAALVGAAFLVALGFWRPSFATRYLIAFMPGLLLGLALLFDKLQRYLRQAPVVLIAAFACGTISTIDDGAPLWKLYNFETASQFLQDAGTKRLVLLWDNPSNAAEMRPLLEIIGGFFFRRAGMDVQVTPIRLEPEDDPNLRLLASGAEPQSGIIWLFDTRVHDTAAIIHPPTLEAIDPAWHCRDFGAPPIGVIACNKDTR
jgi:hypothetical protein